MVHTVLLPPLLLRLLLLPATPQGRLPPAPSDRSCCELPSIARVAFLRCTPTSSTSCARAFSSPASQGVAYQKRKLRDRQAEFPHRPALSRYHQWHVVLGWITRSERRSRVARVAPKDERRAPRGSHGRAFGELYLRLGAQYLFVHHGNCEHDIVFTRCSLRAPLIRRTRQRTRASYGAPNEKTTMCTVYNSHAAAWDIHGDRLADTLPYQLCGGCHFEAHYRADKQPHRTDYRVYPMLDNSERRDVVTGAWSCIGCGGRIKLFTVSTMKVQVMCHVE